MSVLSRICPIVLTLCLLAGCSQPIIKDEVSPEFAAEDLYPVSNTGFAGAFVRRDADLSSYQLVDIQPLGVDGIDIPTTTVMGTSRRDWQMTEAREDALRAAWTEAMNRAFRTYGHATTGPGVLRITAKLTRIAPGLATVTTIGSELQPVGSSQDVVEIWAEFRLLDAEHDTLLAVIRDSRTITSRAMSRTAPITMTLLFGSWAELLHTRIAAR